MTMKLNKHLISTCMLMLLVAVVLSTGTSVFGQGKQNAPGQTKKENQGNSKKQDEVIVGSVDTMSGNTIQLEEKKGKKQEIVVDKDTKVIGQGGKAQKLGAIKLKNIIAVIGDQEVTPSSQAGKFKVKKLFVQEATESAQLKRRAVQGVITDIAGNVLTLAHQIHRERVSTVIVGDTTVIKTKEASESGVLSMLSVGQRIVAVGDLSETGGILAKRIHVIPGKATGIFKKQPVATPSAVITTGITATPSTTPTTAATPSATLTPTIPLKSPTPTLTL